MHSLPESTGSPTRDPVAEAMRLLAGLPTGVIGEVLYWMAERYKGRLPAGDVRRAKQVALRAMQEKER